MQKKFYLFAKNNLRCYLLSFRHLYHSSIIFFSFIFIHNFVKTHLKYFTKLRYICTIYF
ncbi:hypothetical protein E2986_14138 [Frieseomelitta varia]|uniref:Uncharacterized protein n=1 Tax=Frieseomelitta varia TaxID=561572 RepID=A0A833VZM3_9HYME|nr:hypothetical protein E2986_14138 [Frieseomelitta varia]